MIHTWKRRSLTEGKVLLSVLGLSVLRQQPRPACLLCLAYVRFSVNKQQPESAPRTHVLAGATPQTEERQDISVWVG